MISVTITPCEHVPQYFRGLLRAFIVTTINLKDYLNMDVQVELMPKMFEQTMKHSI